MLKILKFLMSAKTFLGIPAMLKGLDILTTIIALSLGHYESNKFMAYLIGINALGAYFLSFLMTILAYTGMYIMFTKYLITSDFYPKILTIYCFGFWLLITGFMFYVVLNNILIIVCG